MYLPASVGNFLAASAAGTVGKVDLGWLFFGAGAVAWLVLGAVLLGRYLSRGRAPAGAAPAARARARTARARARRVAGARRRRARRDVAGRSSGSRSSSPLVLLRLGAGFRGGAVRPRRTGPSPSRSRRSRRRAPPGPPRRTSSIAAALALPLFVSRTAVVAVIAFQTVVAISKGRFSSGQ